MTTRGRLHTATGAELDAPRLYELLRLRSDVFVVEQACPYPELDGHDLASGTVHFWVSEPDGHGVLATLRLLDLGDDEFRIGRVCTHRNHRGQGLGNLLLEAALDVVGARVCHVDAQTFLAGMYEAFGFVTSGEDYLDDGIAYRRLTRDLHGRRAEGDT